MRVAVTGGAGFIGSNLVARLRKHGHHAVVVDDFSTGFASNLDADVEILEGSILDGPLLDRALAGADAVVHLAARPSVPRSLEDPLHTHDVNVNGTVSVLEAVRRAGGRHIIVASSSSVYGANPAMPKREDLACRPVSPYAASKLAAEAYALAYGRSFGLPVLAFRFFNVYGPLQSTGHAYAAVVPSFVSHAIAGEPLQIFGDGLQSRDFTFVGTVTAVLEAALTRSVTDAEPVNLAFGSRRTLLELVSELEAVFGRTLEREHLPERVGDVRHSQADATRLHAMFPDIAPVGLHEGLAKTADWFRAAVPQR